MNSYSLGISGNIWLMVILIISAVLFTIYTYRITIPEISSPKKNLLISLRSLALALLLFVIFEPLLSRVLSTFDTPKIITLLDNSESMSIKDAKQDRKSVYKNTLASIKELLGLGKTYIFDEKTFLKQNISFDSLNLRGSSTDIHQAIKLAANSNVNENNQAYVLISDGNFNKGESPLLGFENTGLPVFVIGIGDTTQPKDILIENILLNEIVFINTIIPINVNINSYGISGETVKVKLLDNDKIISEQSLNITSDKNNYSLLFNYNANQEGTHKITAVIDDINGEITTVNNKKSEFIKVIKSKRKIALFAGAPSPDYSFIKNIYGKEEGVVIKNYVQISKDQFLETPTTQDLKEAEIIITIGFPTQNTPQQLIDQVAQELENGKPILFISSLDLAYNRLGKLAAYLPFTLSSHNPREIQVQTNVMPQFLSSPLLKITGSENDLKEWNKLPPIFKTETFVQTKPNSQVVMNMKFNNQILNEPLVISRDFNNKKATAIMAYGIYRWKLMGFASDISKGNRESYDLLTLFFDNIYKYLSIKNDNKLFKLTTGKSHYSQNEKVDFIAQLFDANYSPLDNAQINIKVTSGSETRDLVLTGIGSGRYQGSLQGLKAQDYFFSGTAETNGNKLGNESGRFSIGTESIERQNLTMNYPLLKEIAARSGGKFYFPNEVSSLTQDIKNLKNFKQKPIIKKDEINLWNATSILFISIILFGLEWLLRKIYGLI